MVKLAERCDGCVITRFLTTKLDARRLAKGASRGTQPTHLVARESENHEPTVLVLVIQGLQTYE